MSKKLTEKVSVKLPQGLKRYSAADGTIPKGIPTGCSAYVKELPKQLIVGNAIRTK
jgi:hypothetical protein